jgi:hypothetical protein
MEGAPGDRAGDGGREGLVNELGVCRCDGHEIRRARNASTCLRIGALVLASPHGGTIFTNCRLSSSARCDSSGRSSRRHCYSNRGQMV